jgi:lysophospholipase L1-like esterase
VCVGWDPTRIGAPVGVVTWKSRGVLAPTSGAEDRGAGAGVRDARRLLRKVQIGDGIVILEIGGNDMIGGEDPKEFYSDLDALCATLESNDRALVMLELPLLPLGNAYGRAQRRVSHRHHLVLIPRRYFASVLSSPDATVDGLHLSMSGQQQMAAMMWDLLHNSIATRSKGPDSKTNNGSLFTRSCSAALASAD